MTETRICDPKEIEENCTKVVAGRKYGPVTVLVRGSERQADGRWLVTFNVKGLIACFTAVWGNEEEMWAACPSSLMSKAVAGAPGEPPEAKSEGVLYLSADYMTRNGIREIPKWPSQLPGPELHGSLRIFPLRLDLTCIALDDDQLVARTFNLLDKELAPQTQTLELERERGSMDLRVNEQIFRLFGIPFDPSSSAVDESIMILKSGTQSTPAQIARAWSVLASAASFLATADEGTADPVTTQLREKLSSALALRP